MDEARVRAFLEAIADVYRAHGLELGTEVLCRLTVEPFNEQNLHVLFDAERPSGSQPNSTG